jgi:hypothetical protein
MMSYATGDSLYGIRVVPEFDYMRIVAERDELVRALREISEKVKRCDYTQARSNALIILAKYPERQ